VARVRGRGKLEILTNIVGREDQLGRYEWKVILKWVLKEVGCFVLECTLMV